MLTAVTQHHPSAISHRSKVKFDHRGVKRATRNKFEWRRPTETARSLAASGWRGNGYWDTEEGGGGKEGGHTDRLPWKGGGGRGNQHN